MKKHRKDAMPGAWVVSPKDKGRKKIYRTKKTNQRKVYLEDKEEFQIEIFNPTKENVLSVIHLDGKPISKSGLIVKNGERIYLDCFIDDRKKFIFETYNVDGESIGVKEAIESNGNLEISFYKEEISDNYILPNLPNPQWSDWGSPLVYGTNGTYFGDGNNHHTYTSLSASSKTSMTTNNLSDFYETGKTGKGEKSNQKFKEVDMDFSPFALNEVFIKLMPKSRKPKTKRDLLKQNPPKSKKVAEWKNPDNPNYKIESLNKLKELSDSGFISKKEVEELKDQIINS